MGLVGRPHSAFAIEIMKQIKVGPSNTPIRYAQIEWPKYIGNYVFYFSPASATTFPTADHGPADSARLHAATAGLLAITAGLLAATSWLQTATDWVYSAPDWIYSATDRAHSATDWVPSATDWAHSDTDWAQSVTDWAQ